MKTKPTRQASSIARIRAARRAEGLCVQCGQPSAAFRCNKCRPKKSAKAVSAARTAAINSRWSAR